MISYSYTSKKGFRHFRDGRVEELPARPGAVVNWPDNINTAGDVVGQSGGQLIAPVVVWRADAPETVELLEGTDNGRYWTVLGIDDGGNVVAYEYGNATDAYVWDRAGNRVKLQPLPGHQSVHPCATVVSSASRRIPSKVARTRSWSSGT